MGTGVQFNKQISDFAPNELKVVSTNAGVSAVPAPAALYRVLPGQSCVLTTCCLLAGGDYPADTRYPHGLCGAPSGPDPIPPPT